MKLFIALFVVLIAVVACSEQSNEDDTGLDIVRSQDNKDTAESIPIIQDASDQSTEGSTQKSITMMEVAQNNDDSSCWTAIRGEVYDLTGWIGQHPGGSGYIRRLCGIEGTDSFETKHGGEDRPEFMLDEFKIGVLV